jgi:hypothetical protein
MGSVRNRLAALFFVITAAAIGFIYLYVVPQLRSSLTAETLHRLERVGQAHSGQLAKALQHGASKARLRTLAGELAQRADARVSLVIVRPGPGAPEALLVIGHPELAQPGAQPSYPTAAAAAASGRVSSGVEQIGGDRTGESAVPLPSIGRLRWVAVLSASLAGVDDNVALIRRQILIAGGIALLVALAAGWIAARAHAKRLARLEAAAERVAGRGAPAAGAELAELAARLTPGSNEPEANRRRIVAAELHLDAGNLGRSRELLEEVTRAAPAGPIRAAALQRLGWVSYHEDGWAAAAALFEAALAEAGDERAQRALAPYAGRFVLAPFAGPMGRVASSPASRS